MQTKDIKVGTEYAYASSKYSLTRRVKVLATGVDGKDWRNKRIASGVQVEHVADDHMNGRVELLRPNAIIQTWAEHEAAQARRAERETIAAAEKAERYMKRSAALFYVHEALLAKGAPVKPTYAYDEEIVAALIAAGFTRAPAESYAGIHSDYINSTIPDMADIVRGKFGAGVPINLVALLIDQEA